MCSAVRDAVERVTRKTAPHHASAMDEELEEILRSSQAKIKVVGVGGAGCNAIQRLCGVGIEAAEKISVNTDAQDLLKKTAENKILIGRTITGGLGAGNDPAIAEECAKEDERLVRDALEGADMVFVTCGLGGGTGSGAAPVVADVARKIGALTVSIVTLPFTVEGMRRQRNAERGLENLRRASDTVIVIPNDKLLDMAPGLPIAAAFRVADDILIRAVKGITDLITEPGLVNLDFADVRSVMKDGGVAMIGMGESDSEHRGGEAVSDALHSPLIDVDVRGATGALINITGSSDMKLEEAEQVVEAVSNELDPEAIIIWGAQIDEKLHGTLRVMVVLAGVNSPYILGPEKGLMIEKEGEYKELDLGIEFL